MSKFIGRIPLPPVTGYTDTLAWDGTEFRPTRSVSINPIFASISAAALAIAFGTGISDSNAIGLLPSTATPGSESLQLFVGGKAGPTWTARGNVVDKTFADGGNVILGTATGTQWGTATNQKQGWYGATPIVQPIGTTDLRTALINLGLYASGGASPLNLNGGAFTAAAITGTVLQGGSGSISAPSLAFSTEATTGLYRPASGVLAIAINGVDRFRFGSNQFTQNFNASVVTGTAPITSIAALSIHGADATNVGIGISAYGAKAQAIFRRANGTAAALTALAANDIIGSITYVGYEGTTPGYATGRDSMQVKAAEPWTSTAQGTLVDLFVTATGATTNTTVMRLMSSGNVGIGTTTDGMTAAGSLAVAQDFAHRGTLLGVFNATPAAKSTGYGTPTGGAKQASFAAGSITLPNLAAAVAQLILDLKNYGLLGT